MLELVGGAPGGETPRVALASGLKTLARASRAPAVRLAVSGIFAGSNLCNGTYELAFRSAGSLWFQRCVPGTASCLIRLRDTASGASAHNGSTRRRQSSQFPVTACDSIRRERCLRVQDAAFPTPVVATAPACDSLQSLRCATACSERWLMTTRRTSR